MPDRLPKNDRRRAALRLVVPLLNLCILCGLLCGLAESSEQMDFSAATVVTAADLTGCEAEAVAMLLDEVERRTAVRWQHSTDWPAGNGPLVAIVSARSVSAFEARLGADVSEHLQSLSEESYRLEVIRGDRPLALVVGHDPRGVLFGVGKLLRSLRMSRDGIWLPSDLKITSGPKYPLRGHQLGYRAKTNSYDGWSVAMWRQYLRDLAVFGTNAIELMPPRTDDDPLSPHFPLPPMRMMSEMSAEADRLDMDVWIWYPAMDADYADPQTVQAALAEWGDVFRQLPRIDAVFVPGGDPGHTRPVHLMSLLKEQSQVLQQSHPGAQMWVSPQGFSQPWLDEFLAILRTEQPQWLAGVVFGPQVRLSLPAIRQAVPARYPIRRYPDITHSRQCQYPVPDWDVTWMLTVGREGINPRPLDQASIFRALDEHAIGFITYSEGCNDDVNKIVWSSLGWDPDQDVLSILREYSRYFIGDRYDDDFAQGLLALERNWRGPVADHRGIDSTLLQFQALERTASPELRLNWRFQQALYRAYYDAYQRQRLLHETAKEERARETLRQAHRIGALIAVDQAEEHLKPCAIGSPAADYRARVFELGEALFQSIRMQLSVQKYQAIHAERGANLDTIDHPLNNRVWLLKRFDEIRRLDDEPQRLAEIDSILNWATPGPGGFYDDLGSPSRQPHLVRGQPYEIDPAHLESPLVGFGNYGTYQATPLSWWNHAESLHDTPLRMRYEGLDPTARYRVRVVYGGDSIRYRIRLSADQAHEIHPYRAKDVPFRPVEFPIPREATADGELVLTWTREPGGAGNGRGCQVSEVWLMKSPVE